MPQGIELTLHRTPVLVAAITARGVANGKLSDPAFAATLDDALPQLAEAVSLAPQLFYRDILTAEALTLS